VYWREAETDWWVLWPPQVAWAHIDIAGPAWDEKAGGATGYGALTLAEWAIAQGA
jgi:leucyl aminopeptidase